MNITNSLSGEDEGDSGGQAYLSNFPRSFYAAFLLLVLRLVLVSLSLYYSPGELVRRAV